MFARDSDDPPDDTRETPDEPLPLTWAGNSGNFNNPVNWDRHRVPLATGNVSFTDADESNGPHFVIASA